MRENEFARWAAVLDEAALARTAVSPFAEASGLDLADAYAVQRRLVRRRLDRGEAVVGLKMGFTSEAMRRQMGVDQPNCGWLTDAMVLARGQSLAFARFIHPRVEPEVAVRLGQDLDGMSDIEAVAAAVEACAPALEAVDSRFRDYRFTLADNTADNSSAAALAIGEWRPLTELGSLSVQLFVDGALIERGSTAAVMGHPMRALAEGARLAASLGSPLRAGMIVITGGITAAPFVHPGQSITANFDRLGEVGLDVTP